MKSKWKDKLPPQLRWLADKVGGHYVETLLFGSTGLSLIISDTRNYIWNSLKNVLLLPPIQWPIQTTAIVLLMVVLMLVIALSLVRYIQAQKTTAKYFFVQVGKFKWKTWRSGRWTEEEPYCAECRMKLTKLGNTYFCPDCNKTFEATNFSLKLSHETANNMAIAIIDKHQKSK